jgi:hypothetical protein
MNFAAKLSFLTVVKDLPIIYCPMDANPDYNGNFAHEE